jgi:hypothetical protein
MAAVVGMRVGAAVRLVLVCAWAERRTGGDEGGGLDGGQNPHRFAHTAATCEKPQLD